MDNIKDNNKGFSLVEMIVSVLISAILTLALAAFMMTSRAAFMKVATGSKLQEEALAAENFMNEIFMEATEVQKKDYGTQTIGSFTGNVTAWIVKGMTNEDGANDNSANSLYFIVFEKPSDGSVGKIRYKKASDSNGVTFNNHNIQNITPETKTECIDNVVGNKYCVISDCVESVSIEQISGKPLVTTSIQFKFNGVTYDSANNVLSRNLGK